MSAAFTFGSFGDVIILYQVATELAQALSGSRGSAKRYQELRKRLEDFTRILIAVSYFCSSSGECLDRL